MSTRWLWAAALLLPAAAAAQRPDEGDLFGAPAESVDAGAPAPVAKSAPPGAADGGTLGQEGPIISRDEEGLKPGGQDAFASGQAVEDPLKIGGRFWFQALSSGGLHQAFGASRVTVPTLIDGYFDARPSDRVRGMVVARLSYDASLPTTITSTTLVSNPDGTITPVTATATNPRVLLDQALLRFDILRTAFLTVGKQHVRWGVSRIWNPTDYLTPLRRDPLAFVDLRLGNSMLKVHFPVESQDANLYVIGLLDNNGPANQFGQLGVALRAEKVFLDTAEVGLGAVFQRGRKPKYAIDISTPLGPLDVYAEVALKQGNDSQLIRCSTPQDPCPFVDLASFELYTPTGFTPQISGGLEWTFAYAENEVASVGTEYFYNSIGTNDPSLYPAQLLTGNFTPFYEGIHYASLFASVIGPGSWEKVSLILFNLANLSDLSFVSRLNFSVQALTYLTVDAFAALHYGNPHGEFRLGINTPEITLPTPPGQPPVVLPALNIPPALWELGVGLRVNL